MNVFSRLARKDLTRVWLAFLSTIAIVLARRLSSSKQPIEVAFDECCALVECGGQPRTRTRTRTRRTGRTRTGRPRTRRTGRPRMGRTGR